MVDEKVQRLLRQRPPELSANSFLLGKREAWMGNRRRAPGKAAYEWDTGAGGGADAIFEQLADSRSGFTRRRKQREWLSIEALDRLNR